MQKPKRIIFVDENGICRAPMAAGIFLSLCPKSDIEILARGILVQFSEPLNQKVNAVLSGNDINMESFSSKQICNEEISNETMIFVMEEKQKERILQRVEYANEGNTYVLSSFVGEELEIMNPYGGSLQTYGICFESIRSIIVELIEMMEASDI